MWSVGLLRALYLHLHILWEAFLRFLPREKPELHVREIDKWSVVTDCLLGGLVHRDNQLLPFWVALLSTALQS